MLIFAWLGQKILNALALSRDFLQLTIETIAHIFLPPFRYKEILRHIYFIGNESAPIVFICVAFAASVTIIETSFHMKMVIQNDSMVPGFASILILRELGSVISCLLIGSRVGAGWAAEIGTMKITEQIDALRMLGIQPVQYLVSTRLVASILSCWAVGTMANIICLFFAMLVTTMKLGYTVGGFLAAMRVFIGFHDLAFAMIKSAVFGAVIPLMACFCGFRCKPGAEGVGIATTNAVVAISVGIIVLDFILGYIFSFVY